MGDGHKQLQLRNWDSATDDRAQCWQTKSQKAKELGSLKHPG
jgi:hypothetical protein